MRRRINPTIMATLFALMLISLGAFDDCSSLCIPTRSFAVHRFPLLPAWLSHSRPGPLQDGIGDFSMQFPRHVEVSLLPETRPWPSEVNRSNLVSPKKSAAFNECPGLPRTDFFSGNNLATVETAGKAGLNERSPATAHRVEGPGGPPGLNVAFVGELASECPAVSQHELINILALIWKVCREEKYHFLRAVAQVRAESDFNERLISSAGAVGLMQVLPKTAEFMGFTDISSPEENIRCGISYMKWLERFITCDGARERWLATLAAYNSGPGRYLEMARRARARYGRSDWAFVAKMYRRRYRPAPGSKLPETLIYIRRNLDTLARLHKHLFQSVPPPPRMLVRVPLAACPEPSLTD